MSDDSTIEVFLSYSRQFIANKDRTINLLTMLENELGIEDLSKMKEPTHILKRIQASEKYQKMLDDSRDKYEINPFRE